MKNINVILKGATKLNKQEMKNVKGGASYCDTLQTIARDDYAINEWTSAQWDAWDHAWSSHCIN
ncbi:hypothetical protein [Proteiniphilum sp.]|uniref:hypothetical protein n=1 Tax=Proteiniphilum sp. TaxID=1926877 RepID=UPI00332C0D0A